MAPQPIIANSVSHFHNADGVYDVVHTGIFRENEAREERIMDSDPLEKQRGITILAKNTAIQYMDTKVCRLLFCIHRLVCESFC